MSGDRRWRIRWLEDQHYNNDNDNHNYSTNNKKQNDISSYMDELDYEEWGGVDGPKTTSNINISTSNNAIPGNMHTELIDILLNPTLVGTIGKRLLHKIGYVDKKDTLKIPEIKSNYHGVGYDPYKEAPEFRKELKDRQVRASQRWDDTNNIVVNREDFIGYKSSSGFALNDEIDDVYDDDIKEFHNHDDIDHNAHDTNAKDNNAPTPHFCKATSHSIQPIRFSGPQPPSTYKENQFVLPNINNPRNDTTCAVYENAATTLPPRLNKSRFTPKQNDNTPITGINFANIGVLMTNRFTSSSASSTTQSNTKLPIGLSRPQYKPQQQYEKQESKQIPKRISIQKSTYTWIPSSLLCKRFSIKPSDHIQTFQKNDNGKDNDDGKVAPSEFDDLFSIHILPKVNETTNSKSAAQQLSIQNDDVTTVDYEFKRPSQDIFKSIYDAPSDDESNNDTNNTALTTSTNPSLQDNQYTTSINNPSAKARIKENNDDYSTCSSSSSSYERKKRKRRKSHKKKRLKHEKYSRKEHRKHKRKRSY